jgi:phosphatidate cytidylyltransferase
VAFPVGAVTLRILSAIVLGAPTVAALWYGRPFLELWLAVFVALMGREWHEMCGGGGWRPARFALVFASLSALLLAGLDRYGAALVLLGLGTAVIYALARGERGLAPGFMAAGLPYIGVSAVALSWLRADSHGTVTLGWVFLVVWATDTVAYAVGKTVGGPKLCPPISPQKTWSGAVAGLLGAAAAGFGMALIAGAEPWVPVIASSALSVVGQAGDLAESAVKRHFGVKDSGSIIPGHGGLFDRADALLAAAPVAALAVYICGADALWR